MKSFPYTTTSTQKKCRQNTTACINKALIVNILLFRFLKIA